MSHFKFREILSRIFPPIPVYRPPGPAARGRGPDHAAVARADIDRTRERHHADLDAVGRGTADAGKDGVDQVLRRGLQVGDLGGTQVATVGRCEFNDRPAPTLRDDPCGTTC